MKQLRAALISGDPLNLIRLTQTGRTKLFTQDPEKALVVMHKLRATLPDMPADVQMQSKIWLTARGMHPRISDEVFNKIAGPKLRRRPLSDGKAPSLLGRRRSPALSTASS